MDYMLVGVLQYQNEAVPDKIMHFRFLLIDMSSVAVVIVYQIGQYLRLIMEHRDLL